MRVRKVICHFSLIPLWLVPWGRLPHRTATTNPTFRSHRQNCKPVPPTGTTQKFPPLNQPLPVGLVDAAASGSVPAFPAGSLDWLVAFLQQIMSPEDDQKYKSSFEPSPAKEEVPLAVQLDNQTKERGTVVAELSTIDMCAVIWRPSSRSSLSCLKKLWSAKQLCRTRSMSLRCELRRRESRVPPVAPSGSPPAVKVAFHPSPEEK